MVAEAEGGRQSGNVSCHGSRDYKRNGERGENGEGRGARLGSHCMCIKREVEEEVREEEEVVGREAVRGWWIGLLEPQEIGSLAGLGERLRGIDGQPEQREICKPWERVNRYLK